MSGASTYFRRRCRVKSEVNTPVSTPSNFFVCEIESLMREQEKILYFGVSALQNSFLLMSLFRESIGFVGGCSGLYFGISCFVTDCVVTLLLYTKAATRTNCSKSRQMNNDGRCNDCYQLQSILCRQNVSSLLPSFSFQR